MALFACAVLAASVATRVVSAGEGVGAPAEMLVIGRIWTGNAKAPWAEAVAIRGERIVAVGTRNDAERSLSRERRVIDAGDGLIVPGLIDSHIHLIEGGLHLTSVQLRDAKSREEFARRIAEAQEKERGQAQFAPRTPQIEPVPSAAKWITGGDWDHTNWGGELPDRRWIDEQTPDTPVWVSRLDGHMALANTAAMRAAGVGDDVQDVPGGEIVRDDAGRPTGIFKDNAMALISKAEPDPTAADRLAATSAAMDYLAARGVTSVHHMGSWPDLEVFRLAHRRGAMKTRVYACTPLAAWQRLAEEVERAGRGDDWLRIGGLKGFVDGSLGSHTAAFLVPFDDAPNDRGLLVNTAEDLEAWTAGADKAGLQVAVHAIGDRAIQLQLDVFERVARQNGPRDRRFRIEHAQHIAPEDVPRFASLGVIPSMQPYHAIDDGRWAERVIGARRSETTYAFRSLIDSGARPAFGSDWPVAPATPLEGIYAAVTRQTLDGAHPGGWVPAQKISVEESLRAYTLDAAHAAFHEDSLGSLEVGKLADLVVLDRDIFTIPANEIRDVKVRLTIVGGKTMFDAEPSAQ